MFPVAYSGEKQPVGPPWQTDYLTAKREAIRTGKPLYIYFPTGH
jgi:hypothetical protein